MGHPLIVLIVEPKALKKPIPVTEPTNVAAMRRHFAQKKASVLEDRTIGRLIHTLLKKSWNMGDFRRADDRKYSGERPPTENLNR
jgi:hypothetical protein